jgi:hypothetical protein
MCKRKLSNGGLKENTNPAESLLGKNPLNLKN